MCVCVNMCVRVCRCMYELKDSDVHTKKNFKKVRPFKENRLGSSLDHLFQSFLRYKVRLCFIIWHVCTLVIACIFAPVYADCFPSATYAILRI